MKHALVLALFIAAGTLHGMEQAEQKSEEAPRPLTHTKSHEHLTRNGNQAAVTYLTARFAGSGVHVSPAPTKNDLSRVCAPICWAIFF